MPLTNTQHDAIMRICNARAQNARRIQEQREAEVYAEIPELAALDEERASLALQKARAAVGLGGGEEWRVKSGERWQKAKGNRLICLTNGGGKRKKGEFVG